VSAPKPIENKEDRNPRQEKPRRNTDPLMQEIEEIQQLESVGWLPKGTAMKALNEYKRKKKAENDDRS
jgi:hypothetical protein